MSTKKKTNKAAEVASYEKRYNNLRAALKCIDVKVLEMEGYTTLFHKPFVDDATFKNLQDGLDFKTENASLRSVLVALIKSCGDGVTINPDCATGRALSDYPYDDRDMLVSRIKNNEALLMRVRSLCFANGVERPNNGAITTTQAVQELVNILNHYYKYYDCIQTLKKLVGKSVRVCALRVEEDGQLCFRSVDNKESVDAINTTIHSQQTKQKGASHEG